MVKRLLYALLSTYSISVMAAHSLTSQVYQGDIVKNDMQFPFVVGIYPKDDDGSSDNEAHCTGSIVGNKWVLTAAHCVIDSDEDNNGNTTQHIMDPKNISVGVGHLARFEAKANHVFSVKNIYIYNDAIDPHLIHDVALLELNENTNITPVSLPSSDINAYLKTGNQHATAIGYGWSNISWSKACAQNPNSDNCYPKLIWDKYLHYGDEVIQSDQTIMNLIDIFSKLEGLPIDSDITYNSITMLGVTSPDGKRCTHGDSGGPLIIKNEKNNGYIQVGVTSWGLMLSYISYKEGYIIKEPSIYANLTDENTLNFIKLTIKNNS